MWRYIVSVSDTIHIGNIFTYDRRSGLPTNDDIHTDSRVDIILNNTVLYNAMIYPFTRMTIKGALWYQGKLSSHTI